MRYTVLEEGNMLDIGGKRRQTGEIITLNKTEAEFELLRETIEVAKDDEAESSKAKGK